MIEGLAAVLVPALAVALSPVPVYAVMLMLDVPRGRSMAAIFLAGWMAGLSLVAYVVLVVIDGVVPDPPDASLGWLSVVLS
ncbi:MAG: GAP family protein, partial [Actinomycetes bacterium]